MLTIFYRDRNSFSPKNRWDKEKIMFWTQLHWLYIEILYKSFVITIGFQRISREFQNFQFSSSNGPISATTGSSASAKNSDIVARWILYRFRTFRGLYGVSKCPCYAGTIFLRVFVVIHGIFIPYLVNQLTYYRVSPLWFHWNGLSHPKWLGSIQR